MQDITKSLRYRVPSTLTGKFHELCFMVDNNRALTFAVDFDGTLYTGNTYPDVLPGCWNSALVRRLQLLKLIYPYFEWVLWTCRDARDLDIAVSGITAELPIQPDAINTNSPNIKRVLHCDPRKIIAILYIDDNSSSISSYCELLTALLRYIVDRREDAIMKSDLFEIRTARKDYICDITGTSIKCGEKYCRVNVYPYPVFHFSLDTTEAQRLDHIFETELNYDKSTDEEDI